MPIRRPASIYQLSTLATAEGSPCVIEAGRIEYSQTHKYDTTEDDRERSGSGSGYNKGFTSICRLRSTPWSSLQTRRPSRHPRRVESRRCPLRSPPQSSRVLHSSSLEVHPLSLHPPTAPSPSDQSRLWSAQVASAVLELEQGPNETELALLQHPLQRVPIHSPPRGWMQQSPGRLP